MGGFAQTLGQLAGEYGDANVKEREFQLGSANIASEMARRQAQSTYEQGELAYRNKALDMGQWGTPQTMMGPDGSFHSYRQNVRTGVVQEVPLPAGMIPSESPIGKAMQLLPALYPGRQWKDLSPEEAQKAVMLAQRLNLGYGLASTQIMDADGTTHPAVLNKMTGEVKPATGPGGAQPVKAQPQLKYETITNPDGSQTLKVVPRYGSAGGGSAAPAAPRPPAAPPAPAFAEGQTAGNGQYIFHKATGWVDSKTGAPVAAAQPAVAAAQPSTMGQAAQGGGIPKAPPKPMSQQAASTLQDIARAETMINGVMPQLSAISGDNSFGSKVHGMMENAKYSMGFNPSDPIYQKIIPLESLLNVMASQPYLHGIRNMMYVTQIQQHMPKATDTPALMVEKLKRMQELIPQLRQDIIQTEQQRMRGPFAATQ